jgi:uncharacterized membrane protein YjjP (DUF1212 family)
MTSDERCNLVLTFARTLFVNGQATEQTVTAAERLARALGLSEAAEAVHHLIEGRPFGRVLMDAQQH